jgi:hypothetical protein
MMVGLYEEVKFCWEICWDQKQLLKKYDANVQVQTLDIMDLIKHHWYQWENIVLNPWTFRLSHFIELLLNSIGTWIDSHE